ncbi:MAG: hypothetical protein H0X45_13540, partial [Planctomycetes bacterium]|nr:hypothetical protein [Planctomycetota bacterium]
REASRREAARAALADVTADSDDSGSKAAVAAATAEPAEPAGAESEPEVDPDDMAWDVKPVAVKDEFDGSVKRVQVKTYEPPPLERKSGS